MLALPRANVYLLSTSLVWLVDCRGCEVLVFFAVAACWRMQPERPSRDVMIREVI